MSVIYPETIVDVLGNVREVVQIYPDGSFNCPHCSYPVVAPALECAHPWCVAHPDYPPEKAREVLAEHAREEAEKRARGRSAELARERVEREARERATFWRNFRAEVERKGACVRCAARSFARGGAPKMVVHRKPCPLGRDPEEGDYMKLSKTKGLK